MSNPLLIASDLPSFSQIKPEHIKPAVEQAITECKKVIATVLEEKTFTWANLVMPTDEADDTLTKLWSPVSHMNSVINSDELRDAYESCLPLLSEYGTFVGQHQGLYEAYQQLADSNEYQQLNIAQKKVIDNALRDFKLSGIALNDDDKKRYGEVVTRLSELSSTFGNNLLDATHAYSVNITDKSELAGLPDSAIEAAAELAKEQEKQGWLFTLDIPSYLPVMMYSSNEKLREHL
jgi:oligopeptidase A